MCRPLRLHSAVRPTTLKSRGYFLKFQLGTYFEKCVGAKEFELIHCGLVGYSSWDLNFLIPLLWISFIKHFSFHFFFQDKNLWSAWSSCSRSCDGGITWRHRCSNHSSEGGPCLLQGLRESQHKICNMHSCPEVSEADQDHCVQHNDVQHEVSFDHRVCWKFEFQVGHSIDIYHE
jgi:hypothetical protein